MIAIVLQVLAGIVGLITLWVKEYNDPEAKQKRAKEAEDERIQAGRRDLSDGNVDAVSARIDRLLSSQDSSNAGSKDNKA
jgi:hypothetical protein